MLHSKVYLFDGKYLTMGSMNNDRWSWKINNEVNIAIHDERECQLIQWYFDEVFRKTKKVEKKYTISSSRAAAITFWQKFLYLSEVLMNTHGNPDEYYDENIDEEGHNILEVSDEKI
jgi:phosphatidylserine/phosphatidylglycerophosphate/cardiolipin synthase-like enzyme